MSTIPTPPPEYLAQILPPAELAGRIESFQSRLAAAGLDGALITHKSGLYYLAGTIQPAHLVVPSQGAPRLLARRSEARLALESPWPVERLDSLRHLAGAIGGGSGARWGLELDVMPVLTFRRYERALPGVVLEDVGTMLREQRAVKSAWEIARLRSIRPLADAMLAAIPDLLRVGMTELDLAAGLEQVARRRRHQGRSWVRAYSMDMYWGHLIAGPSGSVGSWFDSPNGGWGLSPAKPDGPGQRVIERGMPVLVDYVAARDGYGLDQSRVAVVGRLPAALEHAYEGSLAVQEAVVAAARPGVSGSALWQVALDTAEAAGISDGFGGRGSSQARFVGHGIGIEVDELPLIAPRQERPLEAGMVFALEPKVVHPTLGIVGIENSWLVTVDGVERLTPTSDDLITIKDG